MKTKLTILGLVMAISFLFTQPLAATEVRVVETSGTCAGSNSCFGKIKLALEVSAGPLKVELLQGNAIKASKSFAKGNFEYVFENLCTGTYEVKYYPEQFPVCPKLIENIQVKDEESFGVTILDWIDNSHVKVGTTKSGNYEYYWSTDNESYTKGTEVSPGIPVNQRFIYVKAVDTNTGCTVIRTIQQLCQPNFSGFMDVYAKIDWEPTADPNKVKVIAKVSRNTGGYQSPSPDVYAITWMGKNNIILGHGTELMIEKSNPNLGSFEFGKVLRLTVEYSCNKSETIAVVDCANLSPDFLSNYLVSENKPYCEGIANSAWVVLKLDEIKTKIASSIRAAMGLSLNQAAIVSTEVNKLSLRQNGLSPVYREGTELRYTPGHYFFFNSDGSYKIDFELLGCKYAFDVNIGKVKPSYAFKGFNNGKCIYERKCSGKAETLSFDATIGDLVQDGSDCGSQGLFCNHLDGINRTVGKDNEEFKKIPAAMFRFVLKEQIDLAYGNGNTSKALELEVLERDVEALMPCNMIKYCPSTFKKISTDKPFINLRTREPEEVCVDGCTKVDCRAGGLGIGDGFGREYNSCDADYAPNYRTPLSKCCPTPVEKSLFALCISYKSMVESGSLQDFYNAHPDFEDSEVEKILIEYTAPGKFEDPRLKCATLPFCPQTFTLMPYKREDPKFPADPSKPLDHVECDQDIAVPNLDSTIIRISLETGKISIIREENGKVKKKNLSIGRACTEWIEDASIKVSEFWKAIAKKLGISRGIKCPSVADLGKKKGAQIGYTVIIPGGNDIWGLQSEGETQNSAIQIFSELVSDDTSIDLDNLGLHQISDTTNKQQLGRFSTIISQGQVSPKLLFSIDSTQHYYNYGHQIKDIDHFEQSGIEHLIEDWDQWRDYYIRKSVAHKEYLIAAQDSNAVWALPLSSDSLVQIEHFSRYDSLLYVAGYYQGLLYLGGQAIDSVAHYNRTGLFFLQISESGQVLNVSLAENIDTTGGIAFSENKAGVVQIAAHAQDDSIKVNGQIKVLPQAGAVFLLSYADDHSLKFLNAVGNSASTFIGGLTLATGGTASTMALFGAGYAQIQNAFPSLHPGDSLTLLSFDQHGNFVKARNSNAAHLIPNKFALSYGSGEGLILGVTYNQTTTLFGDTLSNEGLEDIAIMKYAANDTLKWGELYGTPDDESISKMLYDPQGIAYFAGEFSGTQEARMIGNYIFTDTTGLPTQRVYLSYVIDTVPSVPNNPTAELLALTPPQTLAANKTPALRDAVQSLGVFPNPFTNQTTVICTTTESGTYTLAVQNELGRVVMQQALDLGIGQQSQVLSTQQLVPGFYYLTLRNAKGKIVGAQKLIKQ